MSLEKENVLLSINKDTLIELRKILFKEKISLHSFYSYISVLATLYDSRLEEIIKEIPKSKEKIKAKSNKKDADTLYEMIEKELLKKQKNGAE